MARLHFFGSVGGCVMSPGDAALLLEPPAWLQDRCVRSQARVCAKATLWFFPNCSERARIRTHLRACLHWKQTRLTPVYVERQQWLSRRRATVRDPFKKTPLVFQNVYFFAPAPLIVRAVGPVSFFGEAVRVFPHKPVGYQFYFLKKITPLSTKTMDFNVSRLLEASLPEI